MPSQTARGSWGIRQLIRLFTVVLGVLFFWLLGFVVKDIKSLPGPDFDEIRDQYVDRALQSKAQQIGTQIGDLERRVKAKEAEQHLAGDSSQNLQRTINQLLELQRLSREKAVALPESEKDNLATSLKGFLASQRSYQSLNQDIAGLTAQKLQLEEEKRQVERQIVDQDRPARDEFQRLAETHRLRLALYQLLILIPLLLVVGYLLIAKRGSIYFPVLVALSGATLVKAALVVHEYFPTRYSKYALIVVLLAVVVRLLVYCIRTAAFPKSEWLAQRYREAYERFLCPVCDYPIRTGPRRFLYWTRRTVHKVFPRGDGVYAEEPYTCPSCGTAVFETCPSCQKVRHSLLPHCEHCGGKKETAAP